MKFSIIPGTASYRVQSILIIQEVCSVHRIVHCVHSCMVKQNLLRLLPVFASPQLVHKDTCSLNTEMYTARSQAAEKDIIMEESGNQCSVVFA